jgi:hypothetical protein
MRKEEKRSYMTRIEIADLYFTHAVKLIDKTLGRGYAKKNPFLVSTFMRACVDTYTREEDEENDYLVGSAEAALFGPPDTHETVA